METLETNQLVGDIVAKFPRSARVFEKLYIDYCCGGKRSLQDVCRAQSLDPISVISKLTDEIEVDDGASDVDPATLSLTALADHVEQTHHAYLKSELPRLLRLSEKVSTVHGQRDARLASVHETMVALSSEMMSHMMKEERVLFPAIRALESANSAGTPFRGSISGPIQQMESEHDQAGSALTNLDTLTDGYTLPEWGCNTYRALLDGLQTLEADLHRHIHKENNILFPKAMELEASQVA